MQADIIRKMAPRHLWLCLVQMLCLILLASPLRADDRGGFFSYFPGVPELHLPHLDLLSPFRTDEFRQARTAYATGDYVQAREIFQRLSQDGNMVADWYLGHIYRLGRGVPPSPAIAYSYYSRVAEYFEPEESDPTRLRIEIDSQLRVADYQRLGIPSAGLKPNPQAAARTYLRFATNYGHPRALYALGLPICVWGQGFRVGFNGKRGRREQAA